MNTEQKLSVDELTDKINDLRDNVGQLEEQGPQPVDPNNPYYNPEYFRQRFLDLDHLHIQRLMALRAEKFKNRHSINHKK